MLFNLINMCRKYTVNYNGSKELFKKSAHTHPHTHSKSQNQEHSSIKNSMPAWCRATAESHTWSEGAAISSERKAQNPTVTNSKELRKCRFSPVRKALSNFSTVPTFLKLGNQYVLWTGQLVKNYCRLLIKNERIKWSIYFIYRQKWTVWSKKTRFPA